jgi:hypothetical protein
VEKLPIVFEEPKVGQLKQMSVSFALHVAVLARAHGKAKGA